MSGVSSMATSSGTFWKITRKVAVPAFVMPAPFAAMMLTFSLLCILAPRLIASVGEQMLRAAPVSGQARTSCLILSLLLCSARALPRVTSMLSKSRHTFGSEREDGLVPLLGATRDTVASTISGVILMVRRYTVGQGLVNGLLPISAFDRNASIAKSLPKRSITTLVIVLCLPCSLHESAAGLRGEA